MLGRAIGDGVIDKVSKTLTAKASDSLYKISISLKCRLLIN